MAPLQLLERILARQLGVIAVWQVASFGMHRSTFVRHARARGYEHLGTGIWAAPWSTPSFERSCVIERVRGPRARLITAGAVFMLLGVRRLAPTRVGLWVGPRLRVRPRPEVDVYRGRWLAGDRVLRVQGIPCTPPLRALRDAAKRDPISRLTKDIAGLDRLRLATPEEAKTYLDRCDPFPGKPKLVEAVDSSIERLVHSSDEAAARQLLADEPFVLHPRPLMIEHMGHRVGEIDIAVCRVRYGAEVDGPTHLLDGAAERDEQRDDRLRQLDWHIDRFPHTFIESDPEGFVRAVRKGVANAAARRTPPWPCDRCPDC
jgi:hypothetical protein